MHLFELGADKMSLIAIKVDQPDIDIRSKEGYQWLQEHLDDETVVFMSASKAYGEEPNLDKFKLIQQGAAITKGDLFRWFARFVEIKE